MPKMTLFLPMAVAALASMVNLRWASLPVCAVYRDTLVDEELHRLLKAA